MGNCEMPVLSEASDEASTAAYCLLLPGKRLYLKALLDMKKFRKWGNKEGAVAAFYRLEEEGLGKVFEVSNFKGTAVVSVAQIHNLMYTKVQCCKSGKGFVRILKQLAIYVLRFQIQCIHRKGEFHHVALDSHC